MSQQRAPSVRPPQGPVGWLLSLAGRVMGLVLGALLLRVVLELLGLYFWWSQDGCRHVFQVMRQDQAELVSALRPHPQGKEIVALLEYGYTRLPNISQRFDSQLIQHDLYSDELYAAPDMAGGDAAPVLSLCAHWTGGRSGAAGSKTVWHRAGVCIYPSARHPVR